MKPTYLVLAAFCGFATLTAAASDTYDPVINNGRVMDPETNYDQGANFGIRDGRIRIRVWPERMAAVSAWPVKMTSH